MVRKLPWAKVLTRAVHGGAGLAPARSNARARTHSPAKRPTDPAFLSEQLVMVARTLGDVLHGVPNGLDDLTIRAETSARHSDAVGAFGCLNGDRTFDGRASGIG